MAVWWLSGGCLKGVWKLFMGCPNGNLVILDCCRHDRSSKGRLSQDRSDSLPAANKRSSGIHRFHMYVNEFLSLQAF